MSQHLFGSLPEIRWYLVAFVFVFPLEIFFGSERSATWSQRFGNLAAMLIHVCWVAWFWKSAKRRRTAGSARV